MAKSQQNFDFSNFDPINIRKIKQKTGKMREILIFAIPAVLKNR